MKAIKTLVAAAAFAVSASAFATPVLPGTEQSLQSIMNSIHVAPGTAPDVNANQANETGLFAIEGSGGSISTMIIEVAGNAGFNTFGIYDPYDPLNSSKYLQLFAGAASGGSKVTLGVGDTNNFSVNFGAETIFSTSIFGYFLKAKDGTMFFSQASLNNGDDHMVAFRGDGDMVDLPNAAPGVWGSSSYILAWEDLQSSTWDQDYNDMVVYVESITAVPEPGSLALLGLGLAGLAAAARRKQKQA